MLTLRIATKADIPVISPWYAAQGDPLNYDELPRETFFICEFNGQPVGSGCLILTNARFVMLEYLATNHDAPEKIQARALRFMALQLEQMSKGLGFRYILGFTPEDHFSLAKFYYRQGAKSFGKLMRLFWKPL